MENTQIREPGSFGKRKEPHTIIVSGNGKSRVFKVNPIYCSIGLCFAAMMLVGYLGATAYLVFRDDLIESSFARQARMQHEYEDRIAALRAKLDRVTSRQLLDQQQIEARVSELMARQATIGKRSGRMGDLLQKATVRGLGVVHRSGNVPVPSVNPQKNPDEKDPVQTGSIAPASAASSTDLASLFSLRGVEPATPPTTPSVLLEDSTPAFAALNIPTFSSANTGELFGEVAQAIGAIDASQREEVDGLRLAAASRTQKITEVLKSVGAAVPSSVESDIGGPFVPIDHSSEFELHLDALEATLEMYDQVAGLANSLPLKNPVPGARISSRYGSRIDPFNGRTAMHGGIDFRARRGTPVRATGEGIVIKAGRHGGYGKLVEIRHRDGLVTRYAHLSKINVKRGEKVRSGQAIGKVGSTGRSTGPHLHYEVRQAGKTRNPAVYLNSGKKLRGLL